MAQETEAGLVGAELSGARSQPLRMHRDARPGIFYGWVIVGAAFVLLMLMTGITYSTPVIFRFFEADFAIGRAQAAFIFSFGQVMGFVAGPFAGSLAQKHGPRVVVGGGVLMLAAGLLGSALAGSYGELLLVYGIAIGIGSGAIYIPLLGLIQRWFYRRRGLASGLATAGVGIGTLTFPIIAAHAADAFGWRSLYLGFAMICVSIGLLAVCVLAADPSERGLNADGAPDHAAPESEEASAGFSLKQALRDRQFYALYFCSFGAALVSFTVFVHLPQQAAEASGDRMQSATIISVIGLASLVARLGGGSWADRIGRIAMVRIALVLIVVTSVLWAFNPWGPNVFPIVAALLGVAYGLCIALLPAVIADSFGNREISGIIGAIYTSFALAAFLGPTVGGLLRDRFGNYDVALEACVALSVVTVLASAGFGKRY